MCQKKTWEGSDKFCIFHDPSPEKDIELFNKNLGEKLQNGDYNFQGYYFPGKAIFGYVNFQEDADFSGATFRGAADFEGATFQDADFSGATFQDADFSGATFQGNARFSEAIFQDANFQRVTFREYADFSGATFQDTDFNETAFQSNAYFQGAGFQKAYFGRATFQRNAYFHGAGFQNADFYGVAFKKDAYFHGAGFQNAYFHKTIFQDADFSGTYIKKNLEFFPYQIEKLNLQNAKFFSRGVITADLTKAKFHRADLENISFTDCIWPEVIYEELNRKDEGLSFRELGTIYRNLKQNMQRHGDYSQAGEFLYREMELRKRVMREKRFSSSWFRSFGYSLFKYACGYGEKPERAIFTSLLTINVFALLYWIFECLQYSTENLAPLQQLSEAIYSSFIIFLIAGIGNIHPINNLGRTLTVCEAMTGVILIVLFVGTLLRKMTR